MSNPSTSRSPPSVNIKLLRSVLSLSSAGLKKRDQLMVNEGPKSSDPSESVKSIQNLAEPSNTADGAKDKPPARAVVIQDIPSVETSGSKRAGKRKAFDTPDQFFIGKSGVSLPVPNADNPQCQKIKCTQRYVPHPHVSYSKKSKAFRFVSPLIYGACMADEEVADDLPSSDLLDLTLQKVGELARLGEMVRIRSLEEGGRDVVGQLSSRIKELELEKEAALRAKDEIGGIRCGLELANAELSLKVRRAEERAIEKEGDVLLLQTEVKSLKESNQRLEGEADQSGKQAEIDAAICYQTTMALVTRKAKAAYPNTEIDWDSLMALRPEDLDEE